MKSTHENVAIQNKMKEGSEKRKMEERKIRKKEGIYTGQLGWNRQVTGKEDYMLRKCQFPVQRLIQRFLLHYQDKQMYFLKVAFFMNSDDIGPQTKDSDEYNSVNLRSKK